MTEGGRAPSTKERWSDLRVPQRAQGLCMRCGGKWSRDHQCPQAVQLHVVQELLDVLQLDEAPEVDTDSVEQSDEQLFLTLSVVAVSGSVAPRNMCFWGYLGNQPVRVLLDYGSSHTFISSVVASQVSNLQPMATPLTVQVANGQSLQCSLHILDAQWSIQHCQFTSDIKVLPLSSYDMILGLDWLEAHGYNLIMKVIQFSWWVFYLSMLGLRLQPSQISLLGLLKSRPSFSITLPCLRHLTSFHPHALVIILSLLFLVLHQFILGHIGFHQLSRTKWNVRSGKCWL
jgi:hypothetical protein